MSFDLRIHNQSTQIETYLNAALYRAVHRASQTSCFIRPAAPLIAATALIIKVAAQVALVFESLLKGSLNIIGSPFHPRCSFCKGLSQVICLAPFELISTPFVIFCAVLNFITNTGKLALLPTEHSKSLWLKNDPVQNEIERQANLAAERDRRISNFNISSENLKTDPNDIASLVVLATELIAGDIYVKDYPRALQYYERAANLGHETSMKLLAGFYRNGVENFVGIDIEKAIHWNQQLVNRDNTSAIAVAATDYFNGKGSRAKNVPEAMRLFHIAAQRGDVQSMFLYGLGNASGLLGIERNMPVAVTWLRMAANKGHLEAKKYLAGILYHPNYRHLQLHRDVHNALGEAYDLTFKEPNPVGMNVVLDMQTQLGI